MISLSGPFSRSLHYACYITPATKILLDRDARLSLRPHLILGICFVLNLGAYVLRAGSRVHEVKSSGGPLRG